MFKEKIHILGICGTFMGGIALLARELGFEVTGSDQNIYPPMSKHLADQGIEIIEGFKKEDLPAANEFIIGNALSRGNEAVEHILNNKLEFSSGPSWLAKNVLKKRKVIAVSGTHGKTTTTAMIASILNAQSIDAGYLIAGKPKGFTTSSHLGSSDIFVIEADEYDTAFFDKRAKFIHYLPETLVINNLEFDHGDIYADISDIQKQFHHLIRTMSSKSTIVCPISDKEIKEVLDMGLWSQLIQYGKKDSLSNYYKKIKSDYSSTLFSIEGEEVILEWDMFGEHNIQNAMSSILSTKNLGISPTLSIEALKNFSGVSRRQEVLFNKKGILFIDDFAHHPSAIETTLRGLREKKKSMRIIALIELRSNTMESGMHDKHLKESVKNADLIYWKGNNKDQIKSLISSQPSKAQQITSVNKTAMHIKKIIKKGDVIISMSNGNFEGLTDKILKDLRKL